MLHMDDVNGNEKKIDTAYMKNEDRELDRMLSEALKPKLKPSAGLNEGILSGEAATDPERQKRGIRKWYLLPKTAVAAAAIVLIGSAGVYAATQLLKDPVVTEHTVSVGNTEYVNDDAIMATETPATVETISTEKGNASTKWQTKKVEKVNGYTNTWLTYADYAEAAEDAGLPRWLGENYKAESPVTFVETKGKGYHSRELHAEFRIHEGTALLITSLADEGVAEDAAYSIQMGHPTNERTYTTKAGIQFRLVDDMVGEGQPITTYVMIAYDRYTGYLAFTGLSEKEIHQVLEDVAF